MSVPLAVNVIGGSPRHIVVPPIAVTVGRRLTVTKAVSLVDPQALFAVTV